MTVIEEARAVHGLPDPEEAKAIRVRARFSQERMARYVGVHRVTLARWESGEQRPRGSASARYALALQELKGSSPLTIDEIRSRATLDVWPETGRLLGLSRNSTYRAVKNGEIPTLRLGSRLLVPVPALLRMLEGDSSGG